MFNTHWNAIKDQGFWIQLAYGHELSKSDDIQEKRAALEVFIEIALQVDAKHEGEERESQMGRAATYFRHMFYDPEFPESAKARLDNGKVKFILSEQFAYRDSKLKEVLSEDEFRAFKEEAERLEATTPEDRYAYAASLLMVNGDSVLSAAHHAYALLSEGYAPAVDFLMKMNRFDTQGAGFDRLDEFFTKIELFTLIQKSMSMQTNEAARNTMISFDGIRWRRPAKELLEQVRQGGQVQQPAPAEAVHGSVELKM